MTEKEINKPESPKTLPIEEAKQQLNILANSIAKPPVKNTEINEVQAKLDELSIETEWVTEITHAALEALRADIQDDNKNLDTKLTVREDGVIDVEQQTPPETPPEAIAPFIPEEVDTED